MLIAHLHTLLHAHHTCSHRNHTQPTTIALVINMSTIELIQHAIREYPYYLQFVRSDGFPPPRTLSGLLSEDLPTLCIDIRQYIADTHITLTDAVAIGHILYLVIKISFQIRLQSIGPLANVAEKITTVVAASRYRNCQLPTLEVTERHIRDKLNASLAVLTSLVTKPGENSQSTSEWECIGLGYD